jgi:nicotinate-nucleotide adenylyltransferase
LSHDYAVMRIGLFGGTFDPVHMGHLLAARAAREEAGLDRMFFIPAAQSPFKPDSRPTPPEQRLRWLRLALAGDVTAEVDEQEIRRGGPSYTIETVQAYARTHPDAELFYLVGADQAAQLHLWRQAAELARLVQVLIIPRPGEAAVELKPPFRGRVLRGVAVGVSSSEIRSRVKAGLPISHLTPAAVAEALANNRLYL